MVTDLWPVPISDRTLTRQEVLGLVLPLWPADEWENAVNVALRESGFRTGAHNTDGEDSRGLWQLNVAEGASPLLAEWNLWDPQLNAYLAHKMWAGRRWRPWLNAAVALGLPLDW